MSKKLATPLLDSLQKQPTMKSKKIYRIELTERDSIFTDMVLDAAVSNGKEYVPLKEIESAAKALCRKYPTTGKEHSVNLIGNVLTIDKGIENILVLTEIEVMELVDEDAPTLNRYANTGITDKENHELLN